MRTMVSQLEYIGNSTEVTNKHPSHKAYAKDNPTIKIIQLLAKYHVDITLHLQNVNNVHAQLRGILHSSIGVRSKYLQNFFNY